MSISTSSTIAPSTADLVAATGTKWKLFKEILESYSEDDLLIQDLFAEGIGKLSLYIFRILFRFEESSSDFRVRVSVYDPKEMKTPQDWWKAKKKELDVTYKKESKLDKLLEEVFKEVMHQLKTKGASVVDLSSKRRSS